MPASRHVTYGQTYHERAKHDQTPHLTAYLLRLMVHKKSNLCLSADVQTTSQLLELVEDCGDSIVLLKTHADIIDDFSHHTIKRLIEISNRKRFLLFEDRKFGDIGNTVQTQYAGGLHRIATWAQFTNAHIFPGPSIVDALKSAAFSALAAGKSSIETEISGGGPPTKELGTYLEEQKQKRRSQLALIRGPSTTAEDGDSSLDEDGGSEEEAKLNPRQRQSLKLDDNLRRKSSIVSVSTTISSSAEYISPPATSHSSSFPHSPRVHESFSPPMVEELPPNPPHARGLLLLAQMSSRDNLLGPAYTRACIQQAQAHRDFVLGFIAQESLNEAPEDNFLTLTPGINLPPANGSKGSNDADESHRADALGQQYNTPRHAILGKGVDLIIVGRGILNASDRGMEARRYQTEGWAAYEERLRG